MSELIRDLVAVLQIEMTAMTTTLDQLEKLLENYSDVLTDEELDQMEKEFQLKYYPDEEPLNT